MSAFRVDRLIDAKFARLLEQTGPADARRYLFAHATLLDQARMEFDSNELEHYRQLLYDWADSWKAAGWPAGRVPRYLFDAYPYLLATVAPGRLESLYTDRAYIDGAVATLGSDQVVSRLRAAITANSSASLQEQLGRPIDQDNK